MVCKASSKRLEPENPIAACGWILRDPVGKTKGQGCGLSSAGLPRMHTALGPEPAEHTLRCGGAGLIQALERWKQGERQRQGKAGERQKQGERERQGRSRTRGEEEERQRERQRQGKRERRDGKKQRQGRGRGRDGEKQRERGRGKARGKVRGSRSFYPTQ